MPTCPNKGTTLLDYPETGPSPALTLGRVSTPFFMTCLCLYCAIRKSLALESLGPKSRGRSTRTRRTRLFLDTKTLSTDNLDGSLIPKDPPADNCQQPKSSTDIAIHSEVYDFPKVAFPTITRSRICRRLPFYNFRTYTSFFFLRRALTLRSSGLASHPA